MATALRVENVSKQYRIYARPGDRLKETLTRGRLKRLALERIQDRLDALGFEDFVAYVVWACERALERGLLPHTNLGALSRRSGWRGPLVGSR